MKAMILRRVVDMRETPAPLEYAEIPDPIPGEGEVLVRVTACGVCHTELDEIEGRTPPPRFPVIPGHQVIGRVASIGSGVSRFSMGDRVGIAWIHSACGNCGECRKGNENLCLHFQATGRDVNGGYAEYMTVSQEFAYPLPAHFTDAQAAPLLCAGAIGYRSLRLTGLQNGQRLGLTGFGASAHLVLKMVRHRFPDTQVFVYARSELEQQFARELGASWAGDSTDTAPLPLHCIIDTTPAWQPVLESLGRLAPGGRLVINAIRKENADRNVLAHLDYPTHLWMEKEIKSITNVTREDVRDFLALAADIPIIPDVQEYPLEQANLALAELKERRIRGAKVLIVAGGK